MSDMLIGIAVGALLSLAIVTMWISASMKHVVTHLGIIAQNTSCPIPDKPPAVIPQSRKYKHI